MPPRSIDQQEFWSDSEPSNGILPSGFTPVPPKYFDVQRIFLSKGCLSTPERERFVRQICDVYPESDLIERLDTPHNKINLGEMDSLSKHRKGKKTLVFGEHKDAVRYSEESGNTCPNYWHFSTYGFCPYGCKYCYLAGSLGVWFSPTIKIFVNIEDLINAIDRVAFKQGRPTAFYAGKLQDGLALDPLTAFSTVLVPFFARHRFARQIILTKSANMERLLSLEHGGHTILSWSLNPPEIAARSEENVPSVDERIAAMRACAERGYPVRAVIMPIIPVEGWEDIYAGFLRRLLKEVKLQRLTIGGICSYRNALSLMNRKAGADNEVSHNIDNNGRGNDGRSRYGRQLRTAMYDHMVSQVRKISPNLELALCLEEDSVLQAVDLTESQGRCNCLL